MLQKKYIESRQLCEVTFALPKAELPEDIEAESVHLVGEFNYWNQTATPMKLGKGQRTFRTTLELAPAQRYQFRYLVNGEYWCNDQQADSYVANDWGQANSVVATPPAATPLEASQES